MVLKTAGIKGYSIDLEGFITCNDRGVIGIEYG
jgi:hypothetical protein